MDKEHTQIGDELTPREYEILKLLARGHTCRAVALGLGIEEQTVKAHGRQ